MPQLSCKELIDIFNKIGGKFVCNYDTKQCTLLPQNVSCKILPENKMDIGSLLTDLAYSGQYHNCVTTIPESEKNKKDRFIRIPLHDYQEKGVDGFIIEFSKDKDGYNVPPSKLS